MSKNTLHYAALEMCSGVSPEHNLVVAMEAIAQAKKKGVQMVGLPECFNMLQLSRKKALACAYQEQDDPHLQALSAQARRLKLWLHIGSMILRSPHHSDRLTNKGFVIDPKGEIKAHYTKIHLYDAEPGDGVSYRESALFDAGTQASVAETPWGGYGMSICYDLRFPVLYQELSKAGAMILSVPAAFTKPTGKAHWEILLRSRAIENACFVVAPAQGGEHQDGRETWGHSMIIDPMGQILACHTDKNPGLISAILDFEQLHAMRRRLPTLNHRRNFQPPVSL